MPRSPTTGVFTRVSNSFSEPVFGTVIDPTDASDLFDDYDGGLTFNDASPLELIGSTSGILKIFAPDTASGAITFPAGTTDFSATGGAGRYVKQASAGAPFTVETVPASEISGAGDLTRVDDTNVTLTLGGTPTGALLKATSITVGWTGTLAAGRLNANVVQAVTDDTNVTGSIGTQTLTLGWTGNLSVPRGGTGVGSFTAYTVLCGGTTSTGAVQNVASVGTAGQALLSAGAGALPAFGDVLRPGATSLITVGYTVTPYNIGTVSSGTTTPAAANGNYQYLTNNGAFTLAAPAADCAIDILVTNGASAGSITFSGFTVGSSTGSSYVTTNTYKFLISIRRINSVATYSIYALQ